MRVATAYDGGCDAQYFGEDQEMLNRRFFGTVAGSVAVLAISVLVGCGIGGGTCNVSGKVTTKGKPVCTGMINLFDAKGVSFTGSIEEDGSYLVVNAPTGVMKVSVISDKPVTRNVNSIKVEPGQPPPPPPPPVGKNWVPVDAKYADPATSGKEITLKSGENVINIDLD